MALLALIRRADLRVSLPEGAPLRGLPQDGRPRSRGVRGLRRGPLVKVLHPVPVHFKGSGFYSTDYGRKGRKRDSSDSSSEDGGKKDESVKKVEKSDKSREEEAGGQGELALF